MKQIFHLKHIWLVLAAYGVWFAILSGIEEIQSGKYWKVIWGLILGIVVYLLVERKLEK